MDSHDILPDAIITESGQISSKFLELGVVSFKDACHHVHSMPYGYNKEKDKPLILFEDNKGSCTTKHGVIALLAEELGVNLKKRLGIYQMTEEIVSGTQEIIEKYQIPYIPMVHCFLTFNQYRFDLTEGNANGKKQHIDTFLTTLQIPPFISLKAEYKWYRDYVENSVMNLPEMKNISLKSILKARQEGIILLKSKV